ncbi:MAG: hypothetical protein OEY59_06750 [Deltaproteobacteria bacterium]|nr:hypothetical protein [Deltaproteobacteria bacterium]
MRKKLSLFFDRKYGGKVIFSDQDLDGPIEVIEKKGIRSLHLGSSATQSSLDLKDLDKLVLKSTRAMIKSLIFLEYVKKILIIGLGGGSIVRFIDKFYPDCEIDIVEKRDSVIQTAFEYFHLPERESIRLFPMDAVEYFVCCDQRQYDLIILDIFDQNGMSEDLKNEFFYSQIRKTLTAKGILTVNLWRKPINDFNQIVLKISKSFQKQVVAYPIENVANCIIHAFNESKAEYSIEELVIKADKLQSLMNIGFPGYLEKQEKFQNTFFDKLPEPLKKPYYHPLVR